MALYDLEVKYEVRLRHEHGYLKAQSAPTSWSFGFPGPCDLAKWRNMLEKMDTLAGSLERRAA